MKGLDNQLYLTMLIISNALALLQLLFVLKWPRIGRLVFFILFALASWINWKTAQENPTTYLEFGKITWAEGYRSFIEGWFASHIPLAVGLIATCQGLIAISMLLKGLLFKIGCMGAIVFFLAIIPLGVGSGFPCTAILAVAMYILWKRHRDTFIWEPINTSAYA